VSKAELCLIILMRHGELPQEDELMKAATPASISSAWLANGK
jgi:hypothetical protein